MRSRDEKTLEKSFLKRTIEARDKYIQEARKKIDNSDEKTLDVIMINNILDQAKDKGFCFPES